MALYALVIRICRLFGVQAITMSLLSTVTCLSLSQVTSWQSSRPPAANKSRLHHLGVKLNTRRGDVCNRSYNYVLTQMME